MKWLRNRKRWAARRALIEHERTLLTLWDSVAELDGRKTARLAALPHHLALLGYLDNERRDRGDALLLAQTGALR